MPLHSEDEGARRHLQRLDHAILGTGGDDEPVPRAIDGLMVDAVHVHGLPFDDAVEEAPRDDLDSVGYLEARDFAVDDRGSSPILPECPGGECRP